MEPREIPNKLTPLPENEFILTAAKAWKRFYGQGPQVKQLACALSQMILEIGRKKQPDGSFMWATSSHNFNMGNIKGRLSDGSSWQYYDCGEEVLLEEAFRLDKESPSRVSILKTYMRGDASMASIWIKAPHPWTRFRAYDTAEDGLLDYLDFLVKERTRYLTAWNQGVLRGDPVTFSEELGKAGYYTASVDRYTKTMVSLFNEFEGKVKAVLESPEGREIYEDEDNVYWEHVMALVGVSIQQSLRGKFDGVEELDEDEARNSIIPNS